MGYKNVCIDCQKAFNLGKNHDDIRKGVCPECGETMILVSQRFRPPKRTDNKKWDVVKYYLSNGFLYDHIQDSKHKSWVPYPENMRGAKEFVNKYKHLING